MNAIHRLRSLDRGLRRVLLRALWLVLLIRIGLWILPSRTLHRAVAARALRRRIRRPHSVEQITWAVTAAARRVPQATCLTQALAAMVLLAANGHPATLRFGVAISAGGGLRAHAWIDSGEKTILADPRSDSLVAFPPIAFRR